MNKNSSKIKIKIFMKGQLKNYSYFLPKKIQTRSISLNPSFKKKIQRNNT